MNISSKRFIILVSIFSCSSMYGIGIDINKPGLTMWQLMNEMHTMLTGASDTISSLVDTVNTVPLSEPTNTPSQPAFDPAALDALTYAVNASTDSLSNLDDTVTSTLEAVKQNGSCIAQMMQTMQTNQQDIDAKLDSLSQELTADDAQIFSAVESVDTHVMQIGKAVKLGGTLLNAKVNALSSQLQEGHSELSDNDAKIFSVIERIETRLTTAPRTPHQEREKPIIESPTSPAQVKFIKNKHLARIGGITITEPGLYILTESLTMDDAQGINIQTDNVTLDLNGFTITATAEHTIPVSVTQADVILIKNGTISGGQGIVITGSYGITLENLMITYPLNTGITLSDVHGVAINHCTVREGAQAGIITNSGSTQIIIRDTCVSDCQGTGFDLQAQGMLLKDSTVQHNGSNGINITNSTDTHVQSIVADNNSGNGIYIENSVERVQVESCRVMGNGGIGCVDNGATLATWMNNLASGNVEGDYKNIKAVLATKASSFWHNVYGK